MTASEFCNYYPCILRGELGGYVVFKIVFYRVEEALIKTIKKMNPCSMIKQCIPAHINTHIY